ncbi:unnamed protein product, partial [Meganyctiphanes norvegica]
MYGFYFIYLINSIVIYSGLILSAEEEQTSRGICGNETMKEELFDMECVFEGVVYLHRSIIEIGCTNLTCHHGQLHDSQHRDKQCSACMVWNPGHVSNLEGRHYNWTTQCNYTALNVDDFLTIDVTLSECSHHYVNTSACIYAVEIKIGTDHIRFMVKELAMGRVWVNDKAVTIKKSLSVSEEALIWRTSNSIHLLARDSVL